MKATTKEYANNFETVAIFCGCDEQEAIDAISWIQEFGSGREEDEILQAIELIKYNVILERYEYTTD